MVTLTVYMKSLATVDRLRLITVIAQYLAAETQLEPTTRSIMEFDGLGKEIWQSFDAERYINGSPGEWDRKP